MGLASAGWTRVEAYDELEPFFGKVCRVRQVGADEVYRLKGTRLFHRKHFHLVDERDQVRHVVNMSSRRQHSIEIRKLAMRCSSLSPTGDAVIDVETSIGWRSIRFTGIGTVNVGLPEQELDGDTLVLLDAMSYAFEYAKTLKGASQAELGCGRGCQEVSLRSPARLCPASIASDEEAVR